MASPTTGRSSARKSSGSKAAEEQQKAKRPRGFQKGDPRINRKGRPKKGETFTDIIRELSEVRDVRTERGEVIKRKQAVVEKVFQKAIREGDFPSIRFLIERVDPPAGEQPEDGSGLVSANIYQAIIAMVRKATAGHPEIRRKIVTEINEAFPGD